MLMLSSAGLTGQVADSRQPAGAAYPLALSMVSPKDAGGLVVVPASPEQCATRAEANGTDLVTGLITVVLCKQADSSERADAARTRLETRLDRTLKAAL
jgi:hypothetical protein